MVRAICLSLFGEFRFLCCILAPAGLAAGLFTGCASTLTPERALERGPLPYHVGLFVDTASLGFKAPAPKDPSAAGEPDPEPIRFLTGAESLKDSLAGALSGSGSVVTKVKILTAQNKRAALAEAQGLDYLIAVGFETPDEYKEYERVPGWVALEIGVWLVSGIPSWFVPSVEYFTPAHLAVEGLDLGERRLRRPELGQDRPRNGGMGGGGPELAGGDLKFDWQEGLDSERHDVSLWDRSHPIDRPLDYVLTIFIPPMFLLPGDRARLSYDLTEGITRDLSAQLSNLIRNKFLDAEATNALSVAFVHPAPGATVKEPAAQLRLGICNRGGVKIRALDLNRTVPGGVPFRWTAGRGDLDDISQALQALSDKNNYALFDVPEAIPLEPGENMVKLRLLREDGELITRTMVYFRH